MADTLIINRFGVFHLVPERLLGTVASQGGRRATPEEQATYEAGQTQLRAPKAATAPPTPTTPAPWADYDDLNAEQIAARLKTLPPAQVGAVWVYEQAHKNRKTIGDAAASLLVDPADEA